METRWVQRFENYKQALSNLSETIDYIKKRGKLQNIHNGFSSSI